MLRYIKNRSGKVPWFHFWYYIAHIKCIYFLDEWFGVTHTAFRDVPTSKMIQLPMQFNTSCYYNYKFLILVLHYFMAFVCDWGLKFAGKKPM